MSDDVKIVEQALDGLQKQLDAKMAEHTAEIQKHGKASTELTGKVDDLATKFAETDAKLRDMIQKAQEGWAGGKPELKTMGREFVDSEQLMQFKAGRSDKARLEVKNTIVGEGGSPVDPVNTIVAQDRLPGIVPGAFRSLSVLDFFPAGTTNSNQIEYTRETIPGGFTNAAAETREGILKPESTLLFELIQDPVRTVAHWLKASRQVLDDAPALETYINRRLSHGVRNRLELQILRGNGTSPNMAGLSASGRSTAFAPVTGESALKSLNRAKYAVIAADETPDVFFMNPADWGSIERDTTSEGLYVAGDGNAISYVANGIQPLAWGIPVITSNNVQEGKFYCVASMATQLFVRSGVTVEMGYVNTDFTQNLVTILAEMRGALAVFRPDAVRYGDLTA
jgi:HK97 family phage major capsid protein